MKHNRYVSLMLIVFLLAIGCSGDYGIIRRQPPSDNKMTLAQLRENWKGYHIYSKKSGNRGNTSNRIMFDPKNNETKLVGDSWHKIEDQQTLSETVGEIQTITEYTEVMIIEGPDGRFFGYMYYSWNKWGGDPVATPSDIVVKRVDEHTLYVQAW